MAMMTPNTHLSFASLWLSMNGNMCSSANWYDWGHLEVCNPSQHEYGTVANRLLAP
jgi:hypothetical protein